MSANIVDLDWEAQATWDDSERARFIQSIQSELVKVYGDGIDPRHYEIERHIMNPQPQARPPAGPHLRPHLLRTGAKASIRIRKHNRYLPFSIRECRYDANGERYYLAEHASGEWAAELEAGRFIPGWPDGRETREADTALTENARVTFEEAGVLHPAWTRS